MRHDRRKHPPFVPIFAVAFPGGKDKSVVKRGHFRPVLISLDILVHAECGGRVNRKVVRNGDESAIHLGSLIICPGCENQVRCEDGHHNFLLVLFRVCAQSELGCVVGISIGIDDPAKHFEVFVVLIALPHEKHLAIPQIRDLDRVLVVVRRSVHLKLRHLQASVDVVDCCKDGVIVAVPLAIVLPGDDELVIVNSSDRHRGLIVLSFSIRPGLG
mmetsp:Transcript_3748/g.5469  ORF Transcript_3748/g.5469 Transcript_3748/m.5469 type:complete len:215 (-) Transcript_3748:462-1106(-)